MLKTRRPARAGRHLVARARHRHGRGRPGRPDRVAQVGGRRPAAGRPRRAPRRRSLERPLLPQVPRRPAGDGGGRRAGCARARSSTRGCRASRWTCSPSRWWRRRRWTSGRSTTCTRWCARAYPYSDSRPPQFEGVLEMLAGRYPSDEFAELRPRIVWDRTAGIVRGRDERPPAGGHVGRHHPRPRPLRRVPGRLRRAGRRARRGDGLRGPLRARCSSWARPPGGSSRSPATGCWSRPRRACPGRCRSGRATASAVRTSWAGRWARPRARAASATSTSWPRATSPTYLDDQESRDRRRARTTARSWSSASATRSATGGCACSRRSAAACTRPGRWRSSGGWATRSGSRSRRIWADDGIAIRLPDSDAPPPVDLIAHRARRARRPR